MHSLIQPSGGTGKKRSFDRIPPSQIQHCEVSGILVTAKGTMVIGINKTRLAISVFYHYYYYSTIGNAVLYLDTSGH